MRIFWAALATVLIAAGCAVGPPITSAQPSPGHRCVHKRIPVEGRPDLRLKVCRIP